MATPKTNSRFLLQDGVIIWYDGPEWDDVAADAFKDMKDTVVAEAQINAPWTDRTGAAREGLDANVIHEGSTIILELFHTVEYGLWLEVIQNGRFATIMPTLEQVAPKAFGYATDKISKARKGRDF